jgi:hypothetical protein
VQIAPALGEATLAPVRRAAALPEHEIHGLARAVGGIGARQPATSALLEKHPAPTAEQIELGVGGNLCRCGTYVGIKAAIAQASGQMRKRGPAKLTRGGKSNG